MSKKYKEGVRFQKSKNSWIAIFIDNDGKYNELYFSINKYKDNAENLAKESYNNKQDIRANLYIEHDNYIEIKIKYLNSYVSAFIDKEDIDKVKIHKWRILKDKNTSYVVSHTADSLHRLIMNPKPNEIVDHINKNGLDNRKQNLRNVPVYINNRNMNLRKDNKSNIIGVFYYEKTNAWRAKWYDENHKMQQKHFSCKKYGYEKAKNLAIETRLEAMKKYEYLYDEKMYEKSSETIPLDESQQE